jgi:hypothetical protein
MIKSILVSFSLIFSVISFAQTKTKVVPKPPISAPIDVAPVVSKSINNAILPAKVPTTNTLVTPSGTTVQANGIKCGAIVVTLDTTIRVNPKYAYLSVEFTNITGTIQAEIVEGNNTFWIFDKMGKEIIVKEKFLKKISAAMGENSSIMLVKIPFKLKTDKSLYTIHYKWENKDKRKNLDLLTIL